MNRSIRVVTLVVVVAALFSATGCDRLKARDQLNKGVNAYKDGKYDLAIEHFKNSVALDPALINARLYLATAYLQQYIPGVESADNKRNAAEAVANYQTVLQRDPNNLNSVKGIAYVYLQMKNFDSAKEYYKKAIQIDPNDAEPYYSVAVIDWTQTYQPRMERRARLGLGPADLLKDKKACEELRTANLEKVQEGKRMLERALQLRSNYDDVMAYLNLIYREQADLECGDSAARQRDLQLADEWVAKTMATKKAKAEKQAAGGITMEPAK